MKLILLGAPGAGKGTQAEIICDKLNIPAVSTGNILREAMKNETEMGLKAKAFIESGALVPDDVIISIIKELSLIHIFRFQHAINQLDNPGRIETVKRDIARVNTVLRANELKDAE